MFFVLSHRTHVERVQKIHSQINLQVSINLHCFPRILDFHLQLWLLRLVINANISCLFTCVDELYGWFQVPLKKVTKGSNRFWFGSLSLDNVLKTNLTIVANDLSGVIYLYDDKGVLVQESFIGGFIKTDNNLSIQVSDFITSTGLQIKSDPGINTVYLSFFLLIVSIYVSFFTYSQIWLVELAKNIKVGGNSNRSVLFFQEDFRKIVRRSINT